MPRKRITYPRQQFVRICDCGCGQPTLLWTQTARSLGRVKGQPATIIHGHQSRNRTPEYIVDEHGCWIWQHGKFGTGYGLCCDAGHNRHAHVVYWERVNGPVPAGLVLDHVYARGCRSRLCVNPAHLEPVTQAENMRRSRRTILTPEDVRAIRALYAAGGILQREIGVRYGVTESTIYGVVARLTWRDIQ